MGGMAFRPKLLWKLFAISVVAFAIVAIIWTKATLVAVDRAYWHEAFMYGHVTREEARAAVGDIVDSWPETPTSPSKDAPSCPCP